MEKSALLTTFSLYKTMTMNFMGNSVPGQYYRAAPPPNFLASPVVDFIVYGNLQQVAYDTDSIPEKDIREKLHNLNAIQDEDLFKNEASANTGI